MAFEKNSDQSTTTSLGMTYADAKKMVEKEGFMFKYLHKCFQTDELGEICNQWWEDRFLQYYEHYRTHPDEAREIMSQAKAAGQTIAIDADMKFDVELEEIPD